MTLPRRVLALLLACALTGCVSAGTDAADDAPPHPDTIGPSARDGNATRTVNASAPAAAAPASDPVVVPFAFDGRTAGGVCPPAPPARGASHCVAATDARGDAPELAGGRPVALHANVTAPDASGVQEYYASMLVDLGNGWEWDPAREPGVTARPPFSVEWDLGAYPEGARFMFYLDAGVSVGGASMMLAEDYRVDGAFTHVPVT